MAPKVRSLKLTDEAAFMSAVCTVLDPRLHRGFERKFQIKDRTPCQTIQVHLELLNTCLKII